MLNGNLALILTLWMVVVIIMAVVRRRKGTAGVGLVLSYVLNLWMLFWLPSFLYLLPWYEGFNREVTIIGAQYSLYAVAAFAFGSLFLAPALLDSGILPRRMGVHTPDARLPKAYLIAGGICYLALLRFLGVASLTALLSAGQQLVVVGLGLCCLWNWMAGNKKKAAMWLLLSFAPPMMTLVAGGYLSYGTAATLSILIFLSNFVKDRIKVVALSLIICYLGLSVYVTYMRDRGQIRQVVWGNKSLSMRVDRIANTASSFELFDPTNLEHLARIDGRLNQAYLMGTAVRHLEQTQQYAQGETLRDSVLALIPRVVWPEKTITAGSGDLVHRFTGIHFDNRATSVGVGQVMEFYGNFGTVGLILGFMAFGLIITTFDILATECLGRGDLQGFVLWYLPGLSFMQVIGQLVEISASGAASLVVAIVVNRILDRYQRRQTEQEAVLELSLQEMA